MEIPAIRTDSEELSPENYLKLLQSDENNIESVEIVPPKLGEHNFGKIKVNYKIPVYKVCYEGGSL